MKNKIIWHRFLSDQKGASVIEAAFILPVLVTIMFGFIDIGSAISVRQKVINSSQIAGDLIARERTLTTPEATQAMEAALLAIDPFDRQEFGIAIIGIRFDDTETAGEPDPQPEEIWRETLGTVDVPASAISNAEGLGVFNEGIIIVVSQYRYVPPFTNTLFPEYVFQEISYFRGRRNSFIPRV